jgi:chaperonin GroES
MKIRPLHDRVVVKRVEAERITSRGVVIPDSAADKPDQGEVLAVGNGKVLAGGEVRKIGVKVGDRVLFGRYAGQTIKVDGQVLLVMRSTTHRMSSSRIMRYSAPSSFSSVPEYFENKILSPTLTGLPAVSTLTFLPIFTISPVPSCPRTTGIRPNGSFLYS